MSRVEDSNTHKYIHVHSKWDYLRTKLKRRGVVEVNESHPHHDMLCAIQIGIRKLLTEHSEPVPKYELTSDDYRSKTEIFVQAPSNKMYCFESYASSVFKCLRLAVDVQEEDMLQNLGPTDQPYLEFISNSRSGQDFYFSNNQRFIIKTDKEHCVEHFLSFLPEYLAHFKTYPHSLLVKFLGVYSIKPPSRKKKYFLAMQNIFYPTMRLEDRFDIKGCLTHRYQNPNPSGSQTILVLKDKNFLDQNIDLGPQRDWFSVQLKADVDFLLSLGVQDYSLLLGRHPLQTDDKRESVSNLFLRIRKSFGHDKKSLPNIPVDFSEDDNAGTHVTSQTQLEPMGSSIDTNTQESNSSPIKEPSQKGEENHQPTQNEPSPGGSTQSNSPRKHNGFLRSLSDSRYLDSTGIKFQNRRLLLNCDNNLHILDGGTHRYYIGIIDFFTLFRCRQQVGKVLKDVKTCCGSHSTEPPDVYAQRFYDFIMEKTV